MRNLATTRCPEIMTHFAWRSIWPKESAEESQIVSFKVSPFPWPERAFEFGPHMIRKCVNCLAAKKEKRKN